MSDIYHQHSPSSPVRSGGSLGDPWGVVENDNAKLETGVNSETLLTDRFIELVATPSVSHRTITDRNPGIAVLSCFKRDNANGFHSNHTAPKTGAAIHYNGISLANARFVPVGIGPI